MKRRKLFIGLFLLISLLFLGVGYAELTNSLSIGGTIASELDDSNLVVEFDKTVFETHVSDDTLAIKSQNIQSNSVSFGVEGFSTQGQSAYVILKVVNNSFAADEYDALLDAIFKIKMTHGNESVENAIGQQDGNTFTGDHFAITVQYLDEYNDKNGDEHTATGTISDAGVTLKAKGNPGENIEGNQYVFVKVSISVVNPIVKPLDAHQFTISFNAKTIDEK
jgi:hypothetical protein